MTRKRLKKLIMGVLNEDRNCAEKLSRFRYLDLKKEVVSNVDKWLILFGAFRREQDKDEIPEKK